MKSILLESLNVAVSMEPTEVVAMAAGVPKLGAVIDVNSTRLNTAAGAGAGMGVVSPPPQAVSRALAPLAPAKGSMGALANSCNKRRRVVSAFVKFIPWALRERAFGARRRRQRVREPDLG